MLLYCLKCRKNTKSKNPRVAKTKKKKENQCFYLNFQCDSKKSRFTKEQEAIGLLSTIEIETPCSKIPLVGALLF